MRSAEVLLVHRRALCAQRTLMYTRDDCRLCRQGALVIHRGACCTQKELNVHLCTIAASVAKQTYAHRGVLFAQGSLVKLNADLCTQRSVACTGA